MHLWQQTDDGLVFANRVLASAQSRMFFYTRLWAHAKCRCGGMETECLTKNGVKVFQL